MASLAKNAETVFEKKLYELVIEYPDVFAQKSDTEFILKGDFSVPDNKNLVILLERTQSLASENDSERRTIKCSKISSVHGEKICLKKLIFDCCFSFDSCYFVEFEDDEIIGCDEEAQARIYTKNSWISITRCMFNNSKVLDLKIDSGSTASIANCTFENAGSSFIYCSDKSYIVIESCKFHHSKDVAISSNKCNLVIKDSTITNSLSNAVYCENSSLFLSDSCFSEIDDTVLYFYYCPNAFITKCNISDCKLSAIFLEHSKLYIEKCIMNNIEGNAIYMKYSSETIMKNNVMTNFSYPFVAAYHNSNVVATENEFNNNGMNAIAINSSSFVFKNNIIRGASQCGIYVAKSKSAIIENNSIFDTKIASIESRDSSIVDVRDNVLANCGQYCFMAYSGGFIKAMHNKITNCSKALCQLRFKGKARIVSNSIDNIIPQYDGSTAGEYLFYDNGQPGLTNMPKEAENLGIKLEPMIKENDELCIKCKRAKRGCFLAPCGHFIYCTDCGEKAVESEEKCPLCRFPISSVVKGFIHSQNNKCEICEKNQSDCIIFPCGHQGLCNNCLTELFSKREECPFCHVSSASFVKIEKNI